MTTQTAPVEDIAADPVVVDSQDPDMSEAAKQTVPTNNNGDAKDCRCSERARRDGSPSNLRSRNLSPSPVRVDKPKYHDGRPPRRRRSSVSTEDFVLLNTSNTLNELLEHSDICVEVCSHTPHPTYITNHAFHPKDIDKIAWVFTIGISDAWMQKPISYVPTNDFIYNQPPSGGPGRRIDSYDDRYDDYERMAISVVHLGCVFRIFRDDLEESQTSKAKFVIAVEGKNGAGWAKLVICYSRQAALIAIFVEILKRNPIIFVGAVLQNAPIPIEFPNSQPADNNYSQSL